MSGVQLLTVIALFVGQPAFAHRELVHDLLELEADKIINPSPPDEKYPKAENYHQDWTTDEGRSRTKEMILEISEELNRTGAEPTPAQAEILADAVPLMQQDVISMFSGGQNCLDLCVLCTPKQEELFTGTLPTFRTVKITRGKNMKSSLKAVPFGVVDTIVGGVGGVVGGVVGGIAGGIVVGGAVGKAAHNESKPNLGSVAGTVLGWASGVLAGGGTAALGAAALGAGGLFGGAWHGAGLTAHNTGCERVGFIQYSNGKEFNLDSDKKQLFKNSSFHSEYGLKKLRAWNSKHTGGHIDRALQEGSDDDLEHTAHCEHLRDHKFDIRHASECVRHSQLCDGPGLVMPRMLHGQCRKTSNVAWLESQAIAFGDDPNEGMFAQWRKAQEEIREETGYDGKRAQCIKMLCKYGGFKKARLLHPDLVDRKAGLSEEEKEERKNMFIFLNNCKSEFTDLEELDADNKIECPPPDED